MEISQKRKAPEMIPFAIAVGKREYASLVNGNDKAEKSTGGITKRSLRLVYK